MLVRDQLNRKINLLAVPRRIISLVPSQTELLVDLGLKELLAGITKFCVHPEDLKSEITVVGGTKKVHFDKIAALKPHLIICNKEENSLEMISVLEKITPVWVSDIATIDDCLEMIQHLGALLNVSEKAEDIISKIISEKEDFKKFMANKPSKKVSYLIWKNPYMAAGKDTFIHSLLEENNFQNIIAETRYPEISLEQLKEADLILLSSEPYPFNEKDVLELREKVNTNVQRVNGEYFSWYGSRLQMAFWYFKTLH